MNEQRNNTPFCAISVPPKGGHLITDDELRERGVSEIDIDALDRKVETQKLSINGRDRQAVEEALATRGMTVGPQ